MKAWAASCLLMTILGPAVSAARAQDTGVKTSGNWEDPSIWTTGSVPDATSNVYVGSNYPSSSASNATVSLTQDEAADALFIGSDDGTSGTVNVGTHRLTITTELNIGYGSGSLTESAGGSFAASLFTVNAGNFTFGPDDRVSEMTGQSNSAVTVTATGNITDTAFVTSGSSLNLDAPLSLKYSLHVVGDDTVVNMNGNPIVANSVFLGYGGNSPVTLNRGGAGGTLTAEVLYVGNSAFDLPVTDNVPNLELANGSITLHSYNSLLTLNLDSGSIATTTVNANVTHNIDVFNGSALNLGANLYLEGGLDVRDSGSVVNMNGHAISANSVLLGFYDDQPMTLNRDGPGGTITAQEVLVGNSTFDLLATDSVETLWLTNAISTLHSNVHDAVAQNRSTITTMASGNITSSLDIWSGSTLQLGADLNLSGTLDVRDLGSSIMANGHNLSAATIYLGYNGTDPVIVHDVGALTTTDALLDHGSSLTIHGGVINHLLSMQNGSTLTVLESSRIGLTLNGGTADSLVIDPSAMNLVFNATGWGFRWQDPLGGGNWVSTLEALIAGDQIQLSAAVSGTFSVYDLDGYTYIGYTAAPEPASIALAGVACLFMVGATIKARRRSRGDA